MNLDTHTLITVPIVLDAYVRAPFHLPTCCLPAQRAPRSSDTVTRNPTTMAPTIHLSNHSTVPFAGWYRTTVDQPLPAEAGEGPQGARFVAGPTFGPGLRAVDFCCDLAPGERRTVDLGAFEPIDFQIQPLPGDILGHFGGAITVNGQPMRLVGLEIEGAAYVVRLRGRIGRMLHVELWVTWYPQQPGIARGEVVVCASNPLVTDMFETLLQPVHIAFGNALVVPFGRVPGAPIVDAATRFADGQARAVPVWFVWLQHLARPSDWASVGALAGLGIGAVGIRNLLGDGNPLYPPSTNPRDFAAAGIPETLRALYTWDYTYGATAQSTVTGAQEDQVFVRGEPLLPGGAGAELVAYLAALTHAKRPCHFLEFDGSPVDQTTHPNCVIWNGRPHGSTAVSPDQLGKDGTVEITPENSPGWWYGPDWEHWLYNTVAAGARFTGSHALQWILEQQARLFLMGLTVPSQRPNWSTNRPWAARARGWVGIIAVHLWRNLRDRQLAGRVRARWIGLWHEVYAPEMEGAPGDIWDVRWNDPRLGNGPWWMPWQQSIGSYGVWLAAREFSVAAARACAFRGAMACVEHNWQLVEGPLWRSSAGLPWTHVGKPTSATYEPVPPSFFQGVPFQGNTWDWSWVPWYFDHTWDVPALVVTLSENPAHELARTIWAQVWQRSGGHGSWFPPGSRELTQSLNLDMPEGDAVFAQPEDSPQAAARLEALLGITLTLTAPAE
jgi:hypothetical protein